MTCKNSFLFITFLLLQCTQSPESKTPETQVQSNLTKEEQVKLEEYKAEVELGRNMAGRLLQYYGTNGDQDLIAYVNQIGNYVASYGDFPDRRYMFAILDSDTVNAFACPGGYILVTLGTIKMAKSEAELGMILGHEAAHVGKKHMFNTLKSMSEADVKKSAEEVSKNSNKELGASQLVRKRPESEDSGTGAVVARYLAGSAGAGLSILQAAKAGMSVILEKGLAPELEYEADQEGVKYAIRAGYQPRALIEFLDRLSKKKAKVNMSVLNKTHPKISDRKSRIESLLKSMKADAIVGAVGKERFDSHTANLGPIQEKKANGKKKE